MNTEQLLRERAESILKEHTALYMTSPEKAVFVNAMIDFHKQELQRIGEENDLMKATLFSITHEAYPQDIFPPITSEQWNEVHQFVVEKLGFSIDRLSAEYGRLLRKPIIDEAKECLKKLSLLEVKGVTDR